MLFDFWIKKNNKSKEEYLNETYPHLSGYFENNDIGYSSQADILKKAQDRFFRDQKEILGAKELNDEQFENILSVNDYTLNIHNDIHEYSFKMDKLWLNEFMDDKSDIVFNGVVNLIVGEKYLFNVNDLIIVKNNES